MINQLMLVVSGSLSARILGPTDRGHAALIALVPSVLSIAGGFGLSVSVRHFTAKVPAATKSTLATIRHDAGAQLTLIMMLHIVVTLVWLAPSLPPSDRAAAFIALAVVPASLITEYSRAVLQGQQRFVAFNVVLVAPPLLLACGVTVLYLTAGGSVTAIILITTGAAVSTALMGITLARGSVRRVAQNKASVSRHELRQFARRTYIGQVAPIEAFRLDQIVVGAALSPTVLGYYTAATAFTNLSRFLGSSIGYVLAPYIASLPEHRQRRSLIRGLAFTAGVCGLVTLLLIPTTEFLVPLLFGPVFRPAIPLSQVLLVVGFLLGVRRAAVAALQAIGLPGLGSYAEALALLIFAGLLPIALHSSTGMGVAIAFLISSVAAMGVLSARAVIRLRHRSAPDVRI